MIVGCYVLDLYCDSALHNPFGEWSGGKQYTGNNYRQASAEAKRNGWKFCRGKRVICPACSVLRIEP